MATAAATLGPDVLAGDVPRLAFSWVPALGLDLALRLDGLSLMFVLLILGIGLLIILYARHYLSTADSMPRFYAFLMLFMAAMLGIVMADNLILLWMFQQNNPIVHTKIQISPSM